MESNPTKVAILGGGCASVAAAFELSRPEHQGKYQITIYQIGWRLGGKGASGRGQSDRIEEHGLHIWMGAYENAFRLMRDCYAELKRDPVKHRIADWRDAFTPAPLLAVSERDAYDSWVSFMSYFPPGDGLPGDPLGDTNPFSITSYLVRMAGLVRTLLLTVQSRGKAKSQSQEEKVQRRSRARVGHAGGTPAEEIIKGLTRLLKFGLLATLAGLVEAAGMLEIVFQSIPLYPDNLIAKLLETAAASSRRQLEMLVGDDPELNWCWVVIDLALTSMVGVLRHGLVTDPRGFDAINDYDVREWLRLNGASERSLDSALLRGAYDLAFAYEDGDYRRPRHAAGVGLRGTLRMLFSARGSIFWKMSAGMGDIVFAPLYEVLKSRGVSFKFFHKLTNLKVSDKLAPGDKPYIEALEFDIQAQTKDGAEYKPLIEIRGLPCWPSCPDYSQLLNCEKLEFKKWNFESNWESRKVDSKTIKVGVDFDAVVFGLGLGAVPYTCKEILKRDQRWRDMVAHVKTVATQAFQIWIREDMQTLGWEYPPVCLAGFAQPFDTWADMSHLIAQETWPTKPRAIAYFVSVLSESGIKGRLTADAYIAACRSAVRTNAINFLDSDIHQLWPKAVRESGGFRWELLLNGTGKRPVSSFATADESQFDTQHWIANVDPSERYILSLPGTVRYRISPLDNTYDNLTIAGDWTSCGFDVGCVEAAVMSGKLAAHAISSLPRLEDIIAYDHP